VGHHALSEDSIARLSEISKVCSLIGFKSETVDHLVDEVLVYLEFSHEHEEFTDVGLGDASQPKHEARDKV